MRAFGWAVGRCDGNDIRALVGRARGARGRAGDRPKLLVADTVKGAGVSFMEPHDLERSATALYAFHSGAPSEEQYDRALAELEARLGERLERARRRAGAARARARSRRARAPRDPQRLVAAYGEALAERGRARRSGSSRSTPTSSSTPA